MRVPVDVVFDGFLFGDAHAARAIRGRAVCVVVAIRTAFDFTSSGASRELSRASILFSSDAFGDFVFVAVFFEAAEFRSPGGARDEGHEHAFGIERVRLTHAEFDVSSGIVVAVEIVDGSHGSDAFLLSGGRRGILHAFFFHV